MAAGVARYSTAILSKVVVSVSYAPNPIDGVTWPGVSDGMRRELQKAGGTPANSNQLLQLIVVLTAAVDMYAL